MTPPRFLALVLPSPGVGPATWALYATAPKLTDDKRVLRPGATGPSVIGQVVEVPGDLTLAAAVDAYGDRATAGLTIERVFA